VIAVEDGDVSEVSTPFLDDVVRLEDRYGRAPAGWAPGTACAVAGSTICLCKLETVC
jgi:hypothetical protein